MHEMLEGESHFIEGESSQPNLMKDGDSLSGMGVSSPIAEEWRKPACQPCEIMIQ
jgi:hypothetical protein